MSLKDKATANYNVAKYSEDKKYYDVAVSRYYYYIYQKILHYFTTKACDSFASGKDCHKDTIELFIREITSNLKRDKKNLLLLKPLYLIEDLRRIRNKSDYGEMSIANEICFKTEFKNKFDDVDRGIKDLII